MVTSKGVKLVILVAIVCFALIACVLLWFSFHSYSQLIDLIITAVNRPDLKPLLTGSLLTQERYNLLYSLHWLLYIADIVFLYIVIKYRYKIAGLFSQVGNACKDGFSVLFRFGKTLTSKEKAACLVVAIVYLAGSVYKITARDITYDEAWNYNYFINTPFYFPFALFNTYPLYHFCAHFFDYLPFDHTINIRLPSVLFGLLFCWMLFFVLKQMFNNKVVYLTILLAISSYVFTAFTCIAKGITFTLFFSLIIYYCVVKIVSVQPRKKYFIIYGIASVLNIITEPSNLIFTIAAALFLLLYFIKEKRKEIFLPLLFLHVFVLILSCFFYVTTIASSGASSILGKSRDSISIGFITERITQFFQRTGCFFFSWDYASVVLTVISLILFFIVKNSVLKQMLLFLCICLLVSIFFAIINVDEMPDRAFTFLFIPFLITFATAIRFFVQKKYLPVIMYTGILAALFFNTYTFVNPPYYQKESKIVSNILISSNITTCYNKSKTFFIHYPIVSYYYTINKKTWVMNTGEENSTRYKPFNITDNYDAVITDTTESVANLPGYITLYKGDSFTIFKRDDSKNEK